MKFSEARQRFIVHLDLINRSKETIRGYKVDLQLFERYLVKCYGEIPNIEAIKVDDIEDFLISMKGEGLAPASRNRRLYSLRSFYKYCAKKGICTSNIAAMVDIARLPFKEREYMTEEEVLDIAKTINHKIVRTTILLLFYSGLRISEALNLKLEDVDLQEGIIRVRSGKGQKDRSVPICPKLQEIITEYLKNIRPVCKSAYFFATTKTGRLSPAYVNLKIHKAVESLGWNRTITAHSFRHSFASALIN